MGTQGDSGRSDAVMATEGEEAVANVAVGYVIAVVTQGLVFPLFGVASRSWWKFRFGVLRVGEASPRQAARSRV